MKIEFESQFRKGRLYRTYQEAELMYKKTTSTNFRGNIHFGDFGDRG